jgi:hypothetical protein
MKDTMMEVMALTNVWETMQSFVIISRRGHNSMVVVTTYQQEQVIGVDVAISVQRMAGSLG